MNRKIKAPRARLSSKPASAGAPRRRRAPPEEALKGQVRIKRLTVERFKQLVSFDLDFNDVTVLIGANNSGKSSVLQALHFAVSVAQTAKLVARNVSWQRGSFLLSFNPAQLIYSPINDVMSLATGGQLEEKAQGQIVIGVESEDGSRTEITVRRGRNLNLAVSIKGRPLGERLMDLDQPFTIYAPGLAGIAKDERFMSAGAVRRVVARGDANLVLRNVLWMLKKAGEAEADTQRIKENVILAAGGDIGVRPPTVWESFQSDMQALFPGIEVEVNFDETRDETINVAFKRPGKPTLPIDAGGTSILQASQILAYVALFKPSVLILDEPDSHLHPDNQRALCNLITDLAQRRGFRALISTHSRHVLDTLGGTARIEWLNNGKKVEYGSVSVASRLMDLGALDSVDYFMDKQLRCLFATEDSSKESMDALEALLKSNNFDMAQTDIRSYSGCSKVDSAKVLRHFLLDTAPRVKFVIHRDRDYMPEDKAAKFEADIEEIDARPFLTRFSDVEGYFLNAEHIAHLNPSITPPRAQEIIDAATVAAKESSLERLINIRTDQANRERKGDKQPNHGKISAEAHRDYEQDPPKWRRGKPVLAQLKHALRQELGKDPDIFLPSPHLADAGISAIHDFVWPPNQPVHAQPNATLEKVAHAAMEAIAAEQAEVPAAIAVGGTQAAHEADAQNTAEPELARLEDAASSTSSPLIRRPRRTTNFD